MLTTVFLDFGQGIGLNQQLETTPEEILEINGPGINGGDGTGPDFTSFGVGLDDDDALYFSPFAYNYSGPPSQTPNSTDLQDLANDVRDIAATILEPFDIDVVIGDASSIADIQSEFTGSCSNNAYVLIGEFATDSSTIAGGSLGEAAYDDLNEQASTQDELAVVFANNVHSDVGTEYDPETSAFNLAFANAIANYAVHEALHTFGISHTAFDIADGDVLDQASGTNNHQRTMVMRAYVAGNHPNRFGYLAQEFGLSPLTAYVTGTGYYDEIRLVATSDPNIVRVEVEVFEDAARTTLFEYSALEQSLLNLPDAYPVSYDATLGYKGYEIDLSNFADRRIIVDAGHRADIIEIDPHIEAEILVRGGPGDDDVVLAGTSDPSRLLGFVFEGENGDDTLTIDFDDGDPLPLAGFDFRFTGGDGADETIVVDESGVTRTAYFVDSTSDAVDANVGDGIAADAAGNSTLRAAIQEINDAAAGAPSFVFLPGGVIALSVQGAGGDTQGDLDISTDVRIYGSGAGVTVIDANSLSDRLFETVGGSTQAHLELHRVTLTGGSTTGDGGAILVNDRTTAGTELGVYDSAFVDNSAGYGGAIAISTGTVFAAIDRSVFADNSASTAGGALTVRSNYAAWIKDSVLAQNTASSGPNIWTATSVTAISQGGNLIEDTSGASLYTGSGDHLDEDVDYVVTSTADAFNLADNQYALSLREAVYAANSNYDTDEEIWLPPWEIVLVLKREEQATDVFAEYGDLTITDALTIRGAGQVSTAMPAVDWRAGVSDEVFRLLADADQDGDVDGDDETLLLSSDISADADQDGYVNAFDEFYFGVMEGKSLELIWPS